MDWLNKLKQYAPDIAVAVLSGGATLPQLAIKAVSDAVGMDDIKDTNSLAKVIEAANPETMLKIKQANNSFLLEMEKLKVEWDKAKLNDEQVSHITTQETIRNGDNSTDKEIRLTRPTMAKQSWTATIAYCIGCFGVRALTDLDIFDWMIAGILSTPAWAYLGLRTGDKFAEALKARKV